MRINTMRCRECHGEMAPRTLDSMAGEDTGLRMQIDGMPVMACAKNHKRFVAPNFAVKMMQALVEGDPLVPVDGAKQKGLLRKRFVCPGCDTDLDDSAGEHVEVKRTLELEGIEAIGVRVEVPKFRCASCGKECALPASLLGNALMKASSQAFRSAEVSPI